jgi:hypothetical protein
MARIHNLILLFEEIRIKEISYINPINVFTLVWLQNSMFVNGLIEFAIDFGIYRTLSEFL